MALVVCQRADVCVLLLISLISADISGDAIVFVSQAERWNIGLLVMVELFIWTTGLLLGYVVHVNDCLRADGAECWERCDDGRVKMIHALSANSSSSAETLHLFFSGTMGLGADPASLFFPPSPTILCNKTFSTCSDVRWWIDLCRRSNTVVCHDDACFWWNWSSQTAKAQGIYADCLTVAYIQRSSLHRKSSWQGETVIVFEIKLWLGWFLFIHSLSWQPIC